MWDISNRKLFSLELPLHLENNLAYLYYYLKCSFLSLVSSSLSLHRCHIALQSEGFLGQIQLPPIIFTGVTSSAIFLYLLFYFCIFFPVDSTDTDAILLHLPPDSSVTFFSFSTFDFLSVEAHESYLLSYS